MSSIDYDDNDDRTFILGKIGKYCYNNPNIYGIDLLIKDEYNRVYKGIEIQRRKNKNWNSMTFLYDTINIFGRKGRYKQNNIFITLNYNREYCIIFDRTAMKEDNKQQINNNEVVYKVDIDDVYIIPSNRLNEVIYMMITDPTTTPKFNDE